MLEARQTLLSRYSVAVLASLLALLVRFLLVPVLGDEAPLLVFIMPVMFSAWYGGLGPGLLAMGLSVLVGTYFFVLPNFSLSVLEWANSVRILIFIIEGILISWLNEALIKSRQRAEKTTLALQESEEQYRLLVEGIKDYAIFMLDPNGRIASWNAGAERLNGYAAPEVLGRHFSILFPPREIERHQLVQELQIAAAEGRYEEQGWRQRKDGSLFWADAVVTALQDDRGNLRGFVKVTRDITDRKAAAEVLQQSEANAKARAEELEIFMETVPVAVWIAHDPECHNMTANRAAHKMVGLASDSVAAVAPDFENYPFAFKNQRRGQDISVDELPMQQAAKTGQSVEADFEMVFETGEVRFIDGRAVPLRDASGNARGVIGAFWDVTEQKQAEERLRQSEERFRHAILDAPLPIMLHTEDGEVVQVNQSWTEITGYRLEDIPTLEAWTEKAYGDRKEEVRAAILTQYPLNQRTSMGEWTITTRTGEIRIWDFYAAPLQMLIESRKLVIVTAIDVTNRKQSEGEILSLNRELQRQLADSQTLLEVLPIGVGIAEDPQCRKIRVNSAFAEMLAINSNANASLTAPEGDRPTNFKVYQNDQELLPEDLPLQRAAADGIEVRDFEVDVVWNDGTTLTLLEYAAPLFDERGQTRGSIGAFLDITARKQAEETLQKTLKDLSDVKFALDQAAILAITDAQGKITEVNDKFCEISQFSREELIGQNHRIINSGYHPKDFFRNLWATIAQGEVWHGELRNRTKDGSYYWVDTTIVPFLDKSGQPFQYLAVRFDITARKQAEEALAEEKATTDLERRRLRAVLDILPVGVFITDANGRLIDINPAAHAVWGGEALLLRTIADYGEHKGWWSGTNYRLSSDEWTAARTLKQGRALFNEEIDIETFDGQRKTILNSAVPIRNETGAIANTVVVNIDITRRKQAEESLRRTAQRLETLQQIDRAILQATSPEAIAHSALLRLNQVITYQQAGVVLFNFESHEAQVLAGQVDSTAAGAVIPIASFSSLEGLRYREAVRYIEDLGTMLQRPPMLEYQFRQGTRSVLIVALLAEGNLIGDLYLFANEPAAFNTENRAIAQEIANPLAVAIQQASLREQLQRYTTELEQRVEARTAELQEANEALQAFTYSVSHDLRAPLRSIEGLGMILLEDYSDRLDEDGQDYIQRVIQASQEMDVLILDLLDYSRLSRTDIQLQALNLNAVVAEVLTHLQDDIDTKQAQVTVEPSLPNVMGNYTILSQVLTNLFTNALKFTQRDRQPQVRLWAEERLDKTGAWVRLWVEDSGIGIEPRFQEQIFQVFERLHSAEIYPGTGIGLGIVRKGIERMGGRAGVDSQVGHGSRFWVELRKPPAA
ncbi:PAS domain S-box protein [Phormidium tenue FACHB-886]|nr:PAS domain S-box protein [Phormidium tenue FACHB-886]